ASLVAQPVALIRRTVAVLLDVVEGPAHDRGKLVDKGRLKRRETVLRHADERLGDGLMRAAFARERDARWRGHHDEARVLVAGVVELIEPARDERVIQRADRQQPLAVDDMRE